nr:hypothetical protein BaRGS_006405 [Batillaria attramentaria]
MPTVTDTYSYKVVITPGRLDVPAGVNTHIHVICYVIVDANTGFYQAVITNGFGQFVFTFEVKEGADGDLDTGTALVLGVVVMLFLDITIVVVLLIWLRRRHWILPCIDESKTSDYEGHLYENNPGKRTEANTDT